MISSDTGPEPRTCLACGWTLRSAKAVARGYGSACWAKIRKAEAATDLSAWTASQLEDAHQAIEDGAVVPSTRVGVFHVVSSDGSEVYRTHRDGCTCPNGLQIHQPRPCWHRCAVAIVAPVPATPARPVLALPAAPVADVPDVWAALEAAGALDLVPAF